MQRENSLNPSKTFMNIRRITKDLQELEKEPAEGVGIAQLGNNIFKYVVNAKILFGCYENFIIQMEMTIPENYPISPPEIRLFPNQNYGNRFHHHIFLASDGYCDLCIDITKNKFLSTNEKGSGWTAAYTLKSLLFQIQNFLAIHDLHQEPNPESVKKLFVQNKAYYRKFFDQEGKEVLHTYENPYPKIHENNNNYNKNNIFNNEQEELEAKEAEAELFRRKLLEEEIKNNITCYITKSNYIEDKKLALGYPVFITYDFKQQSEFIPIPEILSYDAFMYQMQQTSNLSKLDSYFSVKFKSSMGEFFSHWFPIYLDENHFQANMQTILNSFSVLKWGPSGHKEYDFKPELIFEIMPNFLNKMVIDIFSKGAFFSKTSIRCYFNFILLFRKLLKIYEKEHKEYVLDKLRAIKKNGDVINKAIVPDIGNFLMLIIFSDVKVKKEIIANIFEDIVSRTFYWVLHVKDKKDENFDFFMGILNNDSNIKNKYSKNELENLLTYSRLELWDELSLSSKNAIMEFYFKESKGNKLIILSILASKKFQNEEFLKRFEANYGVLLDSEVTEFLDLAKNKFNSIKNIYDLSQELNLEFVFKNREKAFEKFLYLYCVANNKCYLTLKISQKFSSMLNQTFYKKFFYENFDYVIKTKISSIENDKDNADKVNDDFQKKNLHELLKNSKNVGEGNKNLSEAFGVGNNSSTVDFDVDKLNQIINKISLNTLNKK
jgi:ubiquitin-protein ligase